MADTYYGGAEFDFGAGGETLTLSFAGMDDSPVEPPAPAPPAPVGYRAAEIPHFRFPFQRTSDGKRIAVAEQDTTDHILSCENVIVRCPSGFREDRPEYGVPWPEYDQEIDSGDMAAALRRWEPRSQADVSYVRDMLGGATITVRIET